MSVRRANEKVIFESFEGPRVTGILGPRRVGKSTLVKDFVQNKTPLCFFNMDSQAEQNDLSTRGLQRLIEEKTHQTLSSGIKTWVVIDEAQKYPSLFDQIKLLYDETKDQGSLKFIITGSSQLDLHQLSTESLAGRIELFQLQEFSLQESLALEGHQNVYCSPLDLILDRRFSELESSISRIGLYRRELQACLNTQLIFGGLPEVLLAKNEEARLRYLSNYLQTYLEKDVRAMSRIDIPAYHKLLEVVAEQTGSVREDQKILDSIHIARDTLKKYREYLLATWVYQEIYPFIQRSLKRLVKTPKGYLINNGLITYLSGISDLPTLEKTGIIGHRLETWFLKELSIAKARHAKKIDIHYWRTHSGLEVDFILAAKPHAYPFEITYRDKIESKKIRNLKTFMEEESADFGFYVYQGEFDFDSTNRIYFLPAFSIG